MLKNFNALTMRFLSLSALVLLVACAGAPQTPSAVQSGPKLQGKSVTVLQPSPSNLTASSLDSWALPSQVGGVLGALAGMEADKAAGRAFVNKFQISDPGNDLVTQLQSRLTTERNATFTANPGKPIDMHPMVLATFANGSDYVLVVTSHKWHFGPHLFNPSKRRLIYSASLRLVDAARRANVVRMECELTQGDDDSAPSAQEYLADQAALFKAQMKVAVAHCVDQFLPELLKV